MITKIELKNFQSHQNSQLDFTNGINVIIGKSNVGKTSILRALWWVLTNRPKGTAFIRQGQNKVEVIVATDKGKVVRQRSEKGNVNDYRVEAGGKEEQFTALGGDVPQEIVDVLGISDWNIQKQLDTHFLLLDSPGRVAKAINDVVHLESGELLASRLASSIRSSEKKCSELKEEIKQLNTELAKYEGLERFSQDLSAVQRLASAIISDYERLEYLAELVSNIAAIEKELERVGSIEELEQVDRGIVELEGLVGACKELYRDVERLMSVSSAIEEIEQKMSLYDETRLRDVQERLVDLEQSLEEIREESCQVRMLSDYVNDVCELEKHVEQASKDVSELEDKLFVELKQIDTCPVCRQVVDDEHREYVVRYYQGK